VWAKLQSVDDLVHTLLDDRRGNCGRITDAQ
jgi:hypothetical protein